MNSKKAITLLVLATLIMTLVPLVPIHADVGIYELQEYDDDPLVEAWVTLSGNVQKGDEIRVYGYGVTAGATVNVYWDNAMKETFSSGTGKVASGTAGKAGEFKIKFTVPEAVFGEHFVWVKDVSSSQTSSIDVYVDPKLSLSPSSGLKGDKVTVSGYGFNYDEDEDTLVSLTCLDIYYGTLFDFTPEEPKTNDLGSFIATFTVPTIPYGSYTIEADDDIVDTTKAFKVGASITLSIAEGPVGSVVTLSGRGFEKDEALTVTIDGPETKTCYILSGGTVRSDGRINAKIVIPSVDLTDDDPTEYDIIVEDLDTGTMLMNTASKTFEVNGEAKIKATPSYGSQGAQITVEGFNFTKQSGTEVDVAFEAATTGAKTFKTDSNGYFKGTMTIPAIGSEDQTLEAEMEDHGIYDSTEIRVGIMLVILTPNTVPSGALVSVTGVGFDDTESLTVTLGDVEWFTATSTATTFSESMNVPSMEPGTYTVTVTEEESEIAVTASLTVTDKTKITLSPVGAPNEYEVTIEGWYFAETPTDESIEFLLYNATSEWILEVNYSNADAEPPIPSQTVYLGLDEDWDDGYFKGKFTIPEEDSISLGLYTLNVTDGEGMFAQIVFQVVPKTTTITPRKSTFRIGETVAYNVQSSFKQIDAYIKIYDPSGNQYWRTDAFATEKWTKIGEVQVYPFYQQTAGGNAMILMEDAPLGTYTWKWYDEDAELLDSGTFAVAAAAEDVLGQQIEDLNQAVTDLQTDVTTVSSEMAGVRTQITNAINAANAAVQAANAATQAVNAVAQTASAASTAATNAANAATEAKNAANGLTTLVYGAIGASLVAALAAIVSLMQISRRIAG